MATIDKFNYLRRLLEGPALATIAGITLSDVSYQQALELLRNRFVNPQLIMSSYIDSLYKSSNQAQVAQKSETSHQVQTTTLVPNDNCASQPVHARSVLLPTAKALVTRVDCNEPASEAQVLLDTEVSALTSVLVCEEL